MKSSNDFFDFEYSSYGMILCDKKQIYFVNRPSQLLRFRQFGETSIQPVKEEQLKSPFSMVKGKSNTHK
jgi:hypothetical protein